MSPLPKPRTPRGSQNPQTEAHEAGWYVHTYPLTEQRGSGASSLVLPSLPLPFIISLSLSLPHPPSSPELKAEHKRLADGVLLPGPWSLRKYERRVLFLVFWFFTFS